VPPTLLINNWAFYIYGSFMIVGVNGINQLIFVMVNYSILIEVRTDSPQQMSERGEGPSHGLGRSSYEFPHWRNKKREGPWQKLCDGRPPA
jgi:hypothetical protein